ncbi:MAG: nitroreductase family deazaflavin-dependent oxidoreductase [Anaerolineae bacterium]|nr:nitroreductase family deazaflavin-dependent oxidoreductase [Anaerolineae bacterium]
MMNQIRYFNKRFLNKLLRKLVYLPFGPFALVKHLGRKSGKAYETPIMAFPIQGGFLIALTYGPQVDWYQNVKAAGHCELVWHNKPFVVSQLEAVEPAAAVPLFPQPQRTILKSMGLVHDFVKMSTA